MYEKGGWTNDNGDYSDSEMDNFDAESYYDEMMQNFDDSQDSAGNIGVLVPTPPGDDSVDPLAARSCSSSTTCTAIRQSRSAATTNMAAYVNT